MAALAAPDRRDVAVRAWATTPSSAPIQRRGGSRQRPEPSLWSLTFDTETGVDLAQGLRVGAYQVRRSGRIQRQGFLVEPSALSDAELDVVRKHAEDRGYEVLKRADFVEQVFFPVAYTRRGRLIGFNLPFDISRLAIHHDTIRAHSPVMRGGFTFQLSPRADRPWVQVRKVGAAASFIRFRAGSGNHPANRNRRNGGTADNNRGFIVDVATLAKALLGSRFSLGRLADTLRTEHRKLEADQHGAAITPDYLDYALQDVQVTWECHQALMERLRNSRLGDHAPDYGIYSEASIGKAHLKNLGVEPWRVLQSDVPHRLLATIMETYYGGRAECAIRRGAIPGVYLDFVSQYPTVFVLQGLSRFLLAEGMTWHESGPEEAQALLDQITAEDVLKPELWGRLHTLVLVAPDGDRLPTRARYGRRSTSNTETGAFTVGMPIRIGGPPQWYTLADCIASKLQTGRAPRILRAMGFEPGAPQPWLNTVQLSDDPRHTVDPRTVDPIKRLVEIRAEVKTEQRAALAAGDVQRANELDAIQQGMKIAANATSYGIPIEVNVTTHRTRETASVHLPDGGDYQTPVWRTEEPGRYFHPLIATLVSSGGRLLLATAIHLAERLGGSHVMCDTDGLFLAATRDGGVMPCPGGRHTSGSQPAIRLLQWDEIRRLVVGPFAALNPYSEAIPGSILEIEDENFDPDTGEQREIECLAISAKRYCLFHRPHGAPPRIVGRPHKLKRSEHGLGHLLRPLPGEHDWITEWWTHLLCLELGYDTADPAWFENLAAGRLTVTTPHELRTWNNHNSTRPYAEQVRPENFLMTAHPLRTQRGRAGVPQCLVAPLSDDPRQRQASAWIDKTGSGTHYRARTQHRGYAVSGSVPVLKYGDYFDEYRGRPEHKALGSDGKPCHAWSRGILRPPVVEASATLVRIGKETTIGADDADPSQSMSPVVVYIARECPVCGQSLTRKQRYCTDRCRKRAGRCGHVRSKG